MKAEEFRALALSLPDVEERAHMRHPDFRVGGRIFASLGYPDAAWGMVKLFPAQQQDFIAANPGVFIPAKGAWGKNGCTCVFLEPAACDVAAEALHAAWRNVAVRTALRRIEESQGIHPIRDKRPTTVKPG